MSRQKNVVKENLNGALPKKRLQNLGKQNRPKRCGQGDQLSKNNEKLSFFSQK